VRLFAVKIGFLFTARFCRTYVSWTIVILSLTTSLILGGEPVLYGTNFAAGGSLCLISVYYSQMSQTLEYMRNTFGS
jgi:hypothetical protein